MSPPSRRAVWISLAALALCACGETPSWEACPCLDSSGVCAPEACVGTPPAVSDAYQVVPSAGLPARVVTQPANNNLDVVVHNGRLYLAFRTAPTHFASEEVRLYVVSTTDERHFRYEAEFHLGKDLREPRFLSFDGTLFLYFAVLGPVQFTFEPEGVMVTEIHGPGDFTEPQWLFEDDTIAWRTRVIDDVPYMLAYRGGAGIYTGDASVLEVSWLTTADGYDWQPVIPDQPVVLTGGVSETDFAFTPDGALIAVSRDEEGDEGGWGTKICRAEAGDLGTWSCVTDPRKYDSPYVFRHGSAIYLIGRRNVTEDGNYDLFMRDLSHEDQTRKYQIEYWYEPKRCSLWQIDPDTLEVTFLLDLPSRGDTCFPGVVPLGENRVRVYNYSSPVDGPDLDWLAGQTGDTNIYAVTLTLPE